MLPSDFGEFMFYRCRYGLYEIHNPLFPATIYIAKNLKYAFFFYNGNMSCYGEITEFSKKPERKKVNRIQKYKQLQLFDKQKGV